MTTTAKKNGLLLSSVALSALLAAWALFPAAAQAQYLDYRASEKPSVETNLDVLDAAPNDAPLAPPPVVRAPVYAPVKLHAPAPAVQLTPPPTAPQPVAATVPLLKPQAAPAATAAAPQAQPVMPRQDASYAQSDVTDIDWQDPRPAPTAQVFAAPAPQPKPVPPLVTADDIAAIPAPVAAKPPVMQAPQPAPQMTPPPAAPVVAAAPVIKPVPAAQRTAPVHQGPYDAAAIKWQGDAPLASGRSTYKPSLLATDDEDTAPSVANAPAPATAPLAPTPSPVVAAAPAAPQAPAAPAAAVLKPLEAMTEAPAPQKPTEPETAPVMSQAPVPELPKTTELSAQSEPALGKTTTDALRQPVSTEMPASPAPFVDSDAENGDDILALATAAKEADAAPAEDVTAEVNAPAAKIAAVTTAAETAKASVPVKAPVEVPAEKPQAAAPAKAETKDTDAAAVPAAETGKTVVAALSSAPATAAPVLKGGVPTMDDLSLKFKGNASELDAQTQDKLRALLPLLSGDDHRRIQVRAYASGEKGSKSSARRISLSRALSVRSFLMDNGVKPARVDVRAMGTETDRAPLDRVDILFER
jgi:outer membrane protein OmpA-like peptidoglycan-associated protein